MEILDICGYHPNPDDSPTQTRIPLAHLPALKRLGISWNRLDFACNFLLMLQIPETLETLCLAEAEFYSVDGHIFYTNDSSDLQPPRDSRIREFQGQGPLKTMDLYARIEEPFSVLGAL